MDSDSTTLKRRRESLSAEGTVSKKHRNLVDESEAVAPAEMKGVSWRLVAVVKNKDNASRDELAAAYPEFFVHSNPDGSIVLSPAQLKEIEKNGLYRYFMRSSLCGARELYLAGKMDEWECDRCSDGRPCDKHCVACGAPGSIETCACGPDFGSPRRLYFLAFPDGPVPYGLSFAKIAEVMPELRPYERRAHQRSDGQVWIPEQLLVEINATQSYRDFITRVPEKQRLDWFQTGADPCPVCASGDVCERHCGTCGGDGPTVKCEDGGHTPYCEGCCHHCDACDDKGRKRKHWLEPLVEHNCDCPDCDYKVPGQATENGTTCAWCLAECTDPELCVDCEGKDCTRHCAECRSLLDQGEKKGYRIEEDGTQFYCLGCCKTCPSCIRRGFDVVAHFRLKPPHKCEDERCLFIGMELCKGCEAFCAPDSESDSSSTS